MLYLFSFDFTGFFLPSFTEFDCQAFCRATARGSKVVTGFLFVFFFLPSLTLFFFFSTGQSTTSKKKNQKKGTKKPNTKNETRTEPFGVPPPPQKKREKKRKKRKKKKEASMTGVDKRSVGVFGGAGRRPIRRAGAERPFHGSYRVLPQYNFFFGSSWTRCNGFYLVLPGFT